MAYPYQIAGTVLASPVTNGASGATYGSHHSVQGVGGYVELSTIAERNLIPVGNTLIADLSSGRRRLGMLVYVAESATTYQLHVDYSTWSGLSDADKISALADNDNWIEYNVGSADSGSTVSVELFTGYTASTDTRLDALEATSGVTVTGYTANNGGITINGNNIELGGEFTTWGTEIKPSGVGSLRIGNGNANIAISAGSVDLFAKDTASNNGIRLHVINGRMYIIDTRNVRKGIEYQADFSSGFVKHSIVDVNYVTGITSNLVTNSEFDTHFDTHVDLITGYTASTNSRIDNLESLTGATREALIYTGATPSTVTVGGLTAGTQLSGRTLSDIIEEMLVMYLAPAFSSFSVSGQASTVEAGTQLSGSKTFTWATSNSSNVYVNSISIRDLSAGTSLAIGLANDGSESVAIATKTLTNAGDSQQWDVHANNSNLAGFNSSPFTITARYYRFFGPASARPTNSATVRALSSKAFQTSDGQTFTLETGTEETKFYVALPPGRTISSVVDVDSLNANITSEYVLVGTVSVNDGGGSGTSRTYNLYEMTVGSPYPESHTHSITTA